MSEAFPAGDGEYSRSKFDCSTLRWRKKKKKKKKKNKKKKRRKSLGASTSVPVEGEREGEREYRRPESFDVARARSPPRYNGREVLGARQDQ